MNTEVKSPAEETTDDVLGRLVGQVKTSLGNIASSIGGSREEAIEMMKKAIAKAEKQEAAEKKSKDLKIVKALCRKHGFTSGQLKGYVKASPAPKVAKAKAGATK
jgi:methionine salvage enolase-phosphatase E1